jgi:hypothetical protein
VPPPRQKVTQRALQDLFNEAGIEVMRARDELSEEVLASRTVGKKDRVKLRLPPGSESQFVVYIDSRGRHIAKVHRYRKPDGSLGASGKPDPKWLRLGGVVYFLGI